MERIFLEQKLLSYNNWWCSHISNQKIYLAKTFGCTRFVYNRMLADRIKSYEENKDLNIKAIKYPTPAQYKLNLSG